MIRSRFGMHMLGLGIVLGMVLAIGPPQSQAGMFDLCANVKQAINYSDPLDIGQLAAATTQEVVVARTDRFEENSLQGLVGFGQQQAVIDDSNLDSKIAVKIIGNGSAVAGVNAHVMPGPEVTGSTDWVRTRDLGRIA